MVHRALRAAHVGRDGPRRCLRPDVPGERPEHAADVLGVPRDAVSPGEVRAPGLVEVPTDGGQRLVHRPTEQRGPPADRDE